MLSRECNFACVFIYLHRQPRLQEKQTQHGKTRDIQGGKDPQDALSLWGISRKRTLYLVALLRE